MTELKKLIMNSLEKLDREINPIRIYIIYGWQQMFFMYWFKLHSLTYIKGKYI